MEPTSAPGAGSPPPPPDTTTSGDPGPSPPPGPSSTTTTTSYNQHHHQHQQQPPSRYESQKRRDWNTFLQYLKNHKPPLTLARCSGAHVIEFLKYLDQFGKTKVHATGCPYFGHPNPPAPCACPLKQAWGSLDALIGRLRAAYEENGGRPESNPFGARAVRIYLREVREAQAKARGIPYEKKKRKRPAVSSSSGGGGGSASGTVNVSVAATQTVQPSSGGDPSSLPAGGDSSGSGSRVGGSSGSAADGSGRTTNVVSTSAAASSTV